MLMITDVDKNIKLCDLISQTDAARVLGKNAWQIQRLMSSKKLETVRLPTGNRAVIRSSLEAYQRGQK